MWEHQAMEITSVPPSSLPGFGWRTNQDRTRLMVIHLWDGRCGHCDVPLVDIEEFHIHPMPLDVDHAQPYGLGGADALMNYIASCDTCNRRRQQKSIDRAETIERLLRVRAALTEEFDDHWNSASSTDPAFSKPFRTGVRCADHDWHILSSPAYWDCRAAIGDLSKAVPSPEEWWSRFGSRSVSVLKAAKLAAQNHGLTGIQPWEVLSHLPRYAIDAHHAATLLATQTTPASFRSLEPAESYLLSVIVPLAATNTAASARRRDNMVARDLHAHLIEHGIDWIGLARLWTARRWPSSHLFFHRKSVLRLATSGKRANLMRLKAFDTARAVDTFLESVGIDPVPPA